MYVPFSELYDKLLVYIDEAVFDGIGGKGVEKHFRNYLCKTYPDKIRETDEELLVSRELVADRYVKEYLKKSDSDFSAKDCAEIAIWRYKAPSQENMSIASLEKKIREIFKEYSEDIYIKRSSGKGNTLCVDRQTANKIMLHPDVKALIKTQTVKAEKNHEDTVEWRAYELRKKKMESIDSQDMDDDIKEESRRILTDEKKQFLMMQALYNCLFTEFDFTKYEQMMAEIEMLDENWDFGERYQKLHSILTADNYENQFYKLKSQSAILDVLADKIADKIIEKMKEKES